MKTLENYVAIDLDTVKQKHLKTSNEHKKEPDYWLVYSPEIVEIIDQYVASGKYPYNRDIEQLAKEKLFPDVQPEDCGHIVYNSQSYRHAIIKAENDKKFETQMTELGFYRLTNELTTEIVGTDRRFELVQDTTNVFGHEGKKISTKRFRLRDWKEQGLHWMDTRSSRKGYHIQIGQFIKEVK